ncbi:MAG: C10 family peptidase [Tannerella sp.]|jgi:hypothetical protein|nr:C10 family peptidase [Tannerella sp.]
MKTMNLKNLLLLVLLVGGFFSCNNEEKNEILSEETQINGYALSDTEARELIAGFKGLQTRSGDVALQEIGTRKSIKNYRVSNGNSQTKEMIPVYEYALTTGSREGYALVIADSRIPNVLVYADYGSLDDTLSIEPLKYYMNTEVPEIISGYITDYYNRLEINTRGSQKNIVTRSDSIGMSVQCFTSEWGQAAPYNSACPIMSGCLPTDAASTPAYGGRAPAGCVPIAIGEIIKYHIDNHAKPNVIQNSYSNVGAFVAHIGSLVDIMYGCNGSGVWYSSFPYIRNALSYYGYHFSSGATYLTSGNGISTLEANLLSGNPVIIEGQCEWVNLEGEIKYTFHAWVIDGQLEYPGYYFHMNWGGNGSSNGYYLCSSPSSIYVGSYYFAFNTFHILTDIYHP